MATGYVLLETSFEYNDEINYSGEEDSGKPVMVYLDENKAKEEMFEKTLSKLKDKNEALNSYGYELRDVINENNIDVITDLVIRNKGSYANVEEIDDFSDWVTKNISNLSKEDQKLIVDNLNITFYQIYETEINDELLLANKEEKQKKIKSNL